MNKLIAASALITLAACSKPAPEPEATTDAVAEASAPEAMPTTTAADGKPSYGKFEVTMKDGSKIVADVKPDGTFQVTDASGAVVDTGKWEQKSPELYCETSDKAGSEQVCYEEKMVDGVYQSKDPKTGDIATVVRLES